MKPGTPQPITMGESAFYIGDKPKTVGIMHPKGDLVIYCTCDTEAKRIVDSMRQAIRNGAVVELSYESIQSALQEFASIADLGRAWNLG